MNDTCEDVDVSTSKVITLSQWGNVQVSFHRGFDAASAYFDFDMAMEHMYAYVCIMTVDGIQQVAMVSRTEDMRVHSIAHESLHAAWRVLDILGITVTSDNHEALAYLSEYIFKEATDFWCNNNGGVHE